MIVLYGGDNGAPLSAQTPSNDLWYYDVGTPNESSLLSLGLSWVFSPQTQIPSSFLQFFFFKLIPKKDSFF